ncbi:hypothetical protein [Lutibacter sp.]|uniref:hypothetical protein n=1 Tax=Lutibacter sp. TaxID=1925666 RepID=UPI0027330887|nr:hypothetical protein [Lutibacter sp.]MDP3311837.1 hypothetical protein [Lutibacter sp.]
MDGIFEVFVLRVKPSESLNDNNFKRHQQRTRELLFIQKGTQKPEQLTADVEPMFVQLKHNNNFKTIFLKWTLKSRIRVRINAFGHNLRKKIVA